MGAALFMSIGIMFLLSIPIITSRLANRMGRNSKIWFLIGLLLPVISTFILFLLPDLTENKEEKK
jgi:MFS family permease